MAEAARGQPARRADHREKQHVSLIVFAGFSFESGPGCHSLAPDNLGFCWMTEAPFMQEHPPN